MPQIYMPNNTHKTVKNLGWLQRHLDQVESVDVRELDSRLHYHGHEGYMSAYLTDGRVYQCTWASLKLCAQWLARPSLHGVKCYWINHETTCDRLKYYHFGG